MSRGETLPVVFSVAVVHGVTVAVMVLARFMIDLETPDGWSGVYSAFVNWDAHHYLRIASSGYEEEFLVVYFPLFPFLVRAVSWLFGDLLLACLVLNFFCHCGAGYCLYRLVRLDYGRDAARWALWAFLAYPAAFVTAAPYTESVHFMLLFAAFLHFRTGRYWTAAGCALLACTARATGIIFVAFVFIEWLGSESKRSTWTRMLPCALAPAVGFCIYLWINWSVTGDPLTFMEVQASNFHRRIALPNEGLIAAWRIFNGNWPEAFTVGSMQLLGAVLAWIVAAAALLRIRPSYGVYCLVLAVVFTFQAWWQSLIRYDMALFPLFIVCGLLSRNGYARTAILVVFAGLQALLAVQFARGWWSV